MTNVILLGSSGFIGTSLLQLLNKEKFRIKAMIHNNPIHMNIELFDGDIRQSGILDDKLDDGDVIVNLIGQTEDDLSNFIETNIIGSLNLLNSCIKKKNIRIILVSSISVYGENLDRPSKESDIPKPQTTYGLVKLVTENLYSYYSKSYGINVIILRMATLYGPHKKTGYFANLIDSIKTGAELIAYNNGMQKRDMLFVDDASRAIIQAIKNPNIGCDVYNISSSQQYSTKEIINLIEKISDKKLNVLFSDVIPDERCLSADNSFAKTKLQFSPKTTIYDGLKITIDSFDHS